MNAEEIALAIFFTVLIISLATCSYFASSIGHHSVGFCPTLNPYNENVAYKCRKKPGIIVDDDDKRARNLSKEAMNVDSSS